MSNFKTKQARINFSGVHISEFFVQLIPDFIFCRNNIPLGVKKSVALISAQVHVTLLEIYNISPLPHFVPTCPAMELTSWLGFTAGF